MRRECMILPAESVIGLYKNFELLEIILYGHVNSSEVSKRQQLPLSIHTNTIEHSSERSLRSITACKLFAEIARYESSLRLRSLATRKARVYFINYEDGQLRRRSVCSQCS